MSPVKAIIALLIGAAIGGTLAWPKQTKQEPASSPLADWQSALTPVAGDLHQILTTWQNLDSGQMEAYFRSVEKQSAFWHGPWKPWQADPFLHATLLDAWNTKSPEKATAFCEEFVNETAIHGDAITFGVSLWFGQRNPLRIPENANSYWLVGIVEADPLLALRRGGEISEDLIPIRRSVFKSAPFSAPEEALTIIDTLKLPLTGDLYHWWVENDPEAAWAAFENRDGLNPSYALQELVLHNPVKATKLIGRLSAARAGGMILKALAGLEADGRLAEAQAFADTLLTSQVLQARDFWLAGDYDRVPVTIAARFAEAPPLTPALQKAILLPKLSLDSLSALSEFAQTGETLDSNEAKLAVLALARQGLAKLWESIATLPDSLLKTTLAAEAAIQSASVAPKEALDVIAGLQSIDLKKTALPIFIASAPDQLRDNIVTNIWPNIPDPDLHNRIAYAISKWQGSSQAQAAWLTANAPDVLNWPDLQRTLGSRWVAEDPEGFTDWLQTINDPETRNGFLTHLITATAATDTAKAEQIASDLLVKGIQIDTNALLALGKALIQSNPVSALAWTERIEDESARALAMTQLLPELKKRSASEFNTILNTAPISEATQEILKAP